mgnify:CR=1 FL=1
MHLHDLSEFLKLSAALNYQLSAAQVGREKLLLTITNNKALPERDRDLLIEVFDYLDGAYGRKRRRLGPMAVLHPLRAAALLTNATANPEMRDLLTVLLHEKFVDIKQTDHAPPEWHDLEQRFHALLRRIDPTDAWYLIERLDLLPRRAGESYYTYIGRLVSRAEQTPEIVRVKLADRLDNTLDMRIDVRDPLEDVDFFAHVFQALFVPKYVGYEPTLAHISEPLAGGRRLYELFKTVVTLSLVRQHHALATDDRGAHLLFDALSVASMKEAQRIVMHIFSYHTTEVSKQRSLLLETMDYCLRGGVVSVTSPSEPHRLDGLFVEIFDHVDKKVRLDKLHKLAENKDLMVEAALAFIVIFLNFIGDPHYYVRGVSAEGISAHPPATH